MPSSAVMAGLAPAIRCEERNAYLKRDHRHKAGDDIEDQSSSAELLRRTGVDHHGLRCQTLPQALNIRPHLMNCGFLDGTVAADVHRGFRDSQEIGEALAVMG